MKQGSTASILDFLRAITKPSVLLIGILALTFYLRLLYFGQYIDGDVGKRAIAWRMAEGEVRDRSRRSGKTASLLMFYSLFIGFFGPSVLGLKMFGAIFVLMAVVAVYWLANQAYGKKVGLLAALLFGVFSSGPMVEGGTVNLETVLHLPYILAMGLFLKAATQDGCVGTSLQASVLHWLRSLSRLVGVLFFVFLCYGINEWWKKKDLFLREQVSLPLYGAVCRDLLPVIGLIVFYHFHGYTLNQLYDSMLGSNLRYMQRGYEYRSLLEFFSSAMKVMLPENGLLWFGTVFAAVYMGRRIWRGEGEARDRILLWWVFWSFAVLWISGTFFYHYFLQIIGPFSVLAAFGIVASWKRAKSLSPSSRFMAQGGWTILIVIMAMVFIKTDYKYFFSTQLLSRRCFSSKFQMASIDQYGLSNVVNREIACYIRDHTDPAETVYVWGIAPQIYFLAQRRAAARYRNNFNMSILVTNNALKALQAYAPMVMEDIRKSRPAYVVQIFRLEDFPELQTFVRDQYVEDNSMQLPILSNRIHLYRRRLDH